VQVRTELAGPFAHGVQLRPQVSTELSGTHWVPHRWKPGLQVKSHTPAAHEAVAPLGGAVHV
jgi:hypothetical protein